MGTKLWVVKQYKEDKRKNGQNRRCQYCGFHTGTGGGYSKHADVKKFFLCNACNAWERRCKKSIQKHDSRPAKCAKNRAIYPISALELESLSRKEDRSLTMTMKEAGFSSSSEEDSSESTFEVS